MLYFLEFHFLKIDLNRLAYSSTSKLFVELSIYKCIYRYIYSQLHIHTQNTAQHITNDFCSSFMFKSVLVWKINYIVTVHLFFIQGYEEKVSSVLWLRFRLFLYF